MKSFYPLLIIILTLLTGCRTKKPLADSGLASQPEAAQQVINYHDPTTWLLGYFTRDQLLRPPHGEWFLKGYEEYQCNDEAISKLNSISKDDLSIKIVMGTWCPDSRREVPRFMRILDLWKFPNEKLTFIGVDESKLSPVGEFDKLNIQRVPTFIFYKNNIETGRIIEVPQTSLEQDIVNILTRNE